MAEPGRREVVSDPLAFNPREREAQITLPTYGVRNPGQGAGNAASKAAASSLNLMEGLQAAAGRLIEAGIDASRVNGKLLAMQGATDAEIAAKGDKYTTQGYQAMKAVNTGAEWFQQEQMYLLNEGKAMDGDTYRQRLMQSQRDVLQNLPADPLVRKAWAASFEDFAPRLMAAHTEEHNKYNEQQTDNEFSRGLNNYSMTSPDSSVVGMEGHFRVQEQAVRAPVNFTDNDADIVVRTMLAEAGGEGYEGMAAVAHVIINRSEDPRWPKSLQDVALQDKQFSAWNKGPGGTNPLKYKTDSVAYQRAMEVFQAVASGHHIDPTRGATHYYSPKGMTALVNEGSQSNLIPGWLKKEEARSGGQIRLGNHIFVGKSNAATGDSMVYRDPMVATDPQMEQGDTGVAVDAASAVGMPAGQTPSERGTRIQQFIQNSPGKPERKATILADEMRRSLALGDDSLFNDAGGIATLRGLGAKPQEIDEVLRAHKQFSEERDNKFDTESEKGRAEILSAVTSGSFTSLDDALVAVDAWHQQYKGTVAEARSLARQVAADWEKSKTSQSDIVPLELRDLGADLFEGIQSGRYDGRDASEKILEWKKDNPGVKDTTINAFIERMYAADQQKKVADKAKVTKAMEKQAETARTVQRVQQALSTDRGLNAITEKVTVDDPLFPGQVTEITGTEFGIRTIKQSVSDSYLKRVERGELTHEQAAPLMTKEIYEKLARQDVYDTEFGNNLAAAVSGDIMRDNKINPDAVAGFDVYMQLYKNPNIGPEYLRGMIKDEDARTLYETAMVMYDGRGDIGSALLRANDQLKMDLTPEVKTKLDGTFSVLAPHQTKGVVAELTGRDSWWNRITGASQSRRTEVHALQNAEDLETYITNKAKSYHMQNPREPAEVSIKKARDDATVNAVVVAGQVIMGDHSKNQRLDQVMGLAEFGRQAPDDAIAKFVENEGEKLWGALFTEQFKSTATGLLGDGPRYTTEAEIGVHYLPATGSVEIVLFKDASRTETVGPPVYKSAKWLGDYYKGTMKQEPTGFDRFMRGVREDLAGADSRSPAEEAGEAMGRTAGRDDRNEPGFWQSIFGN